MDQQSDKLLWTHKNPTSTRIHEFKTLLESKYGVTLHDYQDLYDWSIAHIDAFWREVWSFTGVKASNLPGKVQ